MNIFALDTLESKTEYPNNSDTNASDDLQTTLNKPITIAQFVLNEIVKESVDAIFLVPGGFVDNLCKAITYTPNLNAYVAASEGGAAMMADGYARVSGCFGVCMGIAGPGASNMITGLSLSKVDEIPVLAITGESPSHWRNRLSIQDCGEQGLNTTNLLKLISKSQYQITNTSLAKEFVNQSISDLRTKSGGVVHLSIPMEQQAKALNLHPCTLTKQKYTSLNSQSSVFDTTSLKMAQSIINESVRAVILVGSEFRQSGAFKELVNFAERHSIPVATTMDTKGDFSEEHPLSLGVFGWAGSRRANELIIKQNIDCLFVIGSSMGQVDTMGWSQELSKERKLIHLSERQFNLDDIYDPTCSISSPISSALEYLNSRKSFNENEISVVNKRKNWVKKIVRTIPLMYEFSGAEDINRDSIHPARIIETAQASLPRDSRVFVDNGAHTFFASHYWKSTRPESFFSAIKFSGAMGWAVPASIGAHIAKRCSKTIVFVGDGCMLMHGIEIQTAIKYQLKDIIFVVVNNQAHGNPKLRAQDQEKALEEMTDIIDHDWSGFAQSLGLNGMTVRRESELRSSFEKAVSIEEPVLIDVKCGLYPTPTKIFDELFMSDFNESLIN